MAPVDPEVLNSNVYPLVLLAAETGSIAFLLATITRFIYRARSTPIATHTRENTSKHRREIAIFAFLTLLGLGLAAYHSFVWRVALYENWAQERAVTVPNKLWGGWYSRPATEDTLASKVGLSGWQLGRFGMDVDLMVESESVRVGTARGFWWTAQAVSGLLIWSIFVGIEGRHRNIPTYITLAFVLLAQLSSLSIAQNLFYILLLLTPVPLAKGAPTDKSHNILTPHPMVLVFPALLSFIWLAFAPTLQDRSLWSYSWSIGYSIVPLLLASLAQPNSLHKVKKHSSVHQARKSYEDIFRALAFASFGLHIMKSYQAIVDEAPPHRYLNHNYVWNTHRKDANTRYQQAWTVIVRVIGALSDNPLISQVGWDVLLSVLSLCVWAVSHGVDVTSMLRCSGLKWSVPSIPSPLPNGESPEVSKAALGDVVEEIADQIQVSPSKRGRGRPKKLSSAIAKDHISSTSGSLRRSTRNRGASQFSQSNDSASEDDGDYVPTKATKSAVEEFDFDHDDGLAKETEAAGLGWGLFCFGGLGAVTAGVLGAETTGR